MTKTVVSQQSFRFKLIITLPMHLLLAIIFIVSYWKCQYEVALMNTLTTEIPIGLHIHTLTQVPKYYRCSHHSLSFVSSNKSGGTRRTLIAVGEVLRRLTSKCVCSLIKDNAGHFLKPLQFGLACLTRL